MPAIRFALLILALAFGQAAHAQAPEPLTAARLEAVLGAAIEERLASSHTPGAVVAVVQDGRIVFAQGYGLANVDTGRRVDADRTLFRIGSISKVFTAVAAIQLVESGRVDLKTDVNRYLRRTRVPATYPEPVTLHHLLTHTAGFDDVSWGRTVFDPAQLRPLDDFLADRIVRRQPPGAISYSTYSSALAGLLVQDVTGAPLRQHMKTAIFDRLGMTRSTISYVPSTWAGDMAVGYGYEDGKLTPYPYEWFHTFPASDVNGTARDMARFMISNLDGAPAGLRLLTPQSLRLMHAKQAQNHAGLKGWAYGWYETYERGHRGLEHGGSMDGFGAVMYLLPERRIGLFVAANSQSALPLEIRSLFLERFLPRGDDRPEDPPSGPQTQLEFLTGRYAWDIYCHSCPPDRRWAPPPLEIAREGDQLIFFGHRWRRLAGDVFERVDEPGERLAFGRDGRGRIDRLFHGENVWERISS